MELEDGANTSGREAFLLILLQWFDRKLESDKLWIDFSEKRSNFSEEFSRFQVWHIWEAEHDKP